MSGGPGSTWPWLLGEHWDEEVTLTLSCGVEVRGILRHAEHLSPSSPSVIAYRVESLDSSYSTWVSAQAIVAVDVAVSS